MGGDEFIIIALYWRETVKVCVCVCIVLYIPPSPLASSNNPAAMNQYHQLVFVFQSTFTDEEE